MSRSALLLCLVALCLPSADLTFRKVGQGPGVLLIHGFGGNKEVWPGVAGELARDYTVLSVDLPGSGGSPGPAVVEGRADFGALAKDWALLVRKEGLFPCLVVGHSMDGPIAVRTVLEDPNAFRGLVLVDGFLSAIPAAFLEPTTRALTKDPAATLGAFLAPLSSGAEQIGLLVAGALKVPIPVPQAYLRAMARDPLAARQAQLRLPVLQLAAGPREADPAKEAAVLAQLGFKDLPAFRVIHFPTAKHWIMWDAPAPFLIALGAFEAGLGR